MPAHCKRKEELEALLRNWKCDSEEFGSMGNLSCLVMSIALVYRIYVYFARMRLTAYDINVVGSQSRSRNVDCSRKHFYC